MPLPSPTPTEDRNDFMGRCMGDPTMRNEFPERDQRLAVCSQRWEDSKEAGMTKANRIPARESWQGDGPLTKFVVPHRKIDEERRSITFTVSTAMKDRDGDRIDQAGWMLDDYRKNPVVLWAHDGGAPPVARAESVGVENDKLVSVATFPTREQYEFGDTVFRLYQGGFLNATSVGFVPEELELIEGENPGDVGFHFRRQKLLEYSVVPIPSNPEALVVARGHGIDVTPCEKWISRILDEHGGGSVKGLLNRTYIALKGRLHPVMQEEIATKNAASLRDRHDKQTDDDERPIMQTSPGGDDGHTHEFREGEPQTEPGGEDGHIHAVTYAEDGSVVIEGAEGHAHEMPGDAEERNGPVEDEHDVDVQTPTNNPLDPEHHEQPLNQREITDWPQKGMSLPVSLLTSEYRTFPLAEAKVLRDDWPEIWALADGPDPEAIEGDEKAVRAREDWAARNIDGHRIEDVVAQVKHLVRGSRGIEHMRLMLSHAKEHVQNQRDRAKGLTPEQVDAVAERVLSKAVIPAIEKAFSRHSGRLS